MQLTMKNSLLLICLVFNFFKTGESIKCYICNSVVEPACGAPFKKEQQEPKECLHGFADHLSTAMGLESSTLLNMSFACMKIIFSDESGRTLTMRGCTFAQKEHEDPCPMTNTIRKMTGEDTNVDYCEVCERDLCNGSNSLSFKLINIIIITYLGSTIFS